MSETIATLLKIIIAIALLIALIAFINWGLEKLDQAKQDAETGIDETSDTTF